MPRLPDPRRGAYKRGRVARPMRAAWSEAPVLDILLVTVAGLWAGVQNALAGGGSFVTFPALLLFGLDARSANITSTVALFAGQVAMSWSGRKDAAGTQGVSLRTLVAISLVGGIAGAFLLLATPAAIFERMVPWLVAFATAVFALGAPLRARLPATANLPPVAVGAIQFAIAVYGGYFGGGIGFLMLAALTLAGMAVRVAGTTKNLLAMVMNAAAVAVFAFSGDVAWGAAAAMGAGSIVGGIAGTWLLRRAPERILRAGIIALGIGLTVWLFVR